MFQQSSARTIDISNLVRLRKHLSWSSQGMAVLGIFSFMAFEKPELTDAVYIGAVGVLALVAGLILYMGWVVAIPPLSISLVTLTTVLTARFVAASMPIDTKDEWWLLICGAAAVATTLWVLALWLAPFARAARRSPYLKLMFATNRKLGVDYAGGALSWKDWLRQLRPWAIVVGALTVVVSVAAMLIASAGTKRRNKEFEKQIRDAVFWAGGALFVWKKRKSALRGTAIRRIDRRPPVLLLRSFDDDMMIILGGTRRSRSTDLHRKG